MKIDFSKMTADDIYGFVIDAGKQNDRTYFKEIWALLDHPEAEARRSAVKTLGCHWSLPEFKEKLYHMALNDSDVMVKADAISALAGYYEKGTCKPSLLSDLFDILWDENEDLTVRGAAFAGIWQVRGEKPNYSLMEKVDYADDPDELESLIPWKTKEEVLR